MTMQIKFSFPVSTISPILLNVANACSAAPVNEKDVTPLILFELTADKLSLTAQNQDYQVLVELPLQDASVSEPYSFLIRGARVKEFFKSLGSGDMAEFELLDEVEGKAPQALSVKSGAGAYTLALATAVDTEHFLKFQDEPELAIFSLPADVLSDMLNKTMFCVSRDNFRDYVKGVRFEVKEKQLAVICLDGHRMALAETQLPEEATAPANFNLTQKGAAELLRQIAVMKDQDVELRLSHNQLTTKIGTLVLKMRLLTCNYPNVRAVFPKKLDFEASVKTQVLKTYLTRLSGFSNNRLHCVNFMFAKDALSLHAQNSSLDVGKASMPIVFERELPHEVNLNIDFMKDFVNAVATENMRFGFHAPYANTLITPEVEESTAIKLKYVISHIVV